MIREVFDARKENIDITPNEFCQTLKILTTFTKRETVLNILDKEPSKWRDACHFELVKSFDHVPAMLKKGFEKLAAEEGLGEQFEEV